MAAQLAQSMATRAQSGLAQAEAALARRLEEARLAEARIESRLELLTKAERGLQATLQTMRQEVAVAMPLLKPLPQMKELVDQRLDEAMVALRTELERWMGALPVEMGKIAEESLQRCRMDAMALEQSLASALTSAAEASQVLLNEHTGQLVLDLDAAAKVFGQDLGAKLEESQKAADALAGTLHRRLEFARVHYGLLESAVEERVREASAEVCTTLAGSGEVVPDAPPADAGPVQGFSRDALKRLEAATARLSQHRPAPETPNAPEKVEVRIPAAAPVAPVSGPKILGRAPEYLRWGERRWRGRLVGDCAMELSVSAA